MGLGGFLFFRQGNVCCFLTNKVTAWAADFSWKVYFENRSDVVESILRRGAGEITALLLKYELWMVILWLQFYKG